MRPSHAPELAAAAAAALQHLDLYLDLLEELVRSPDDSQLYGGNSDAFDAMRGLTAALPQVRACWVEVLISRFELLDALGQPRADAEGQVAGLHQRHLQNLEHFRRLCWRSSSIEVAATPKAERPPRGSETLIQGVQRRLLEAEQRVQQQRERVHQLEAAGADAAAARRILGSMERALDVMDSSVDVARQRSH